MLDSNIEKIFPFTILRRGGGIHKTQEFIIKKYI